MPLSDEHEEKKIQDAIELIQKYPRTTPAEVARKTRCAYYRLTCRLNGIPRLSSREGHNIEIKGRMQI